MNKTFTSQEKVLVSFTVTTSLISRPRYHVWFTNLWEEQNWHKFLSLFIRRDTHANSKLKLWRTELSPPSRLTPATPIPMYKLANSLNTVDAFRIRVFSHHLTFPGNKIYTPTTLCERLLLVPHSCSIASFPWTAGVSEYSLRFLSSWFADRWSLRQLTSTRNIRPPIYFSVRRHFLANVFG